MGRFMLRFLMIVLILDGVIACSGRSASPSGSPTHSNPQASGGVDGSGGFTGKSTVDQVSEAHGKALAKMAETLRRVESIIKFGKMDPADKRWTQHRVELLTAMIQGNQKMNQPVRELLSSGQIEWNLRKNAPCDATDSRHTDGAAKEPRAICISLYTLTRFAYTDLQPKLIQLYGHELAHLYFGSDEDMAVEVDSFFSEISDIAFPDAGKIKKTLEEMNMTAIPEWPEENINRPDSGCSTPVIYLNYGYIIEFRDFFKKPDPTVYFSPELKEIFQPARTYMDNMQTDNDQSKKCGDDPRKFFFYDQVPDAIASFKGAVAYWSEFYSDILK